MATRLKAVMGHEGRAQTYAKDQIVAERLEPHGILERRSLRRPLVLHHQMIIMMIFFGIQRGARVEGVLRT